ncbi:MAG: hypothetical protein EOP35_18215, partial [Rubrivivax sp.]
FEGRTPAAGDEAFDTDLALATGELAMLIPALIAGLGGEHDFADLAKVAAEHNARSPHAPAAAPAAPVGAYHPDAETDPMYAQALQIVQQNRRASISLVQRHLRIGYNRAARLLDRMQGEGLIGPLLADGGREFLGKAVAA